MDIIDFESFFNIIYLGVVPKLEMAFKRHSFFDVNHISIRSE
jgi:hypothetical protein